MSSEESSWLCGIPRGVTETQVTPVYHGTGLGKFGFRHWTVTKPNGKTATYPGSLWDEKRQLWWGWEHGKHDKVLIWHGPPPPK